MPTPSTASKDTSLRIWAVVLARAGSQRLPNKAMLPLCGSPMASWYFKALENVNGIERRFLFSDDESLKRLVQMEHPRIEIPPFQRPSAVSDANTSSFDSLAYFLQEWQRRNLASLPEWIMLCQCTSPLVQTIDFEKALEQLNDQEMSPKAGLLSVCPPSKPLSWLLKKAEQKVVPFQNTLFATAEQDYVTPNGAFYIIPTQALLEKPVGFSLWDLEDVLAYEMPWQRSIDIDTAPDFQVAEALLDAQLKMQSPTLESSALESSVLEKTTVTAKPVPPRKQLNPLNRLHRNERKQN